MLCIEIYFYNYVFDTADANCKKLISGLTFSVMTGVTEAGSPCVGCVGCFVFQNESTIVKKRNLTNCLNLFLARY